MTDLASWLLAQIADDEHFWRGIGDSEHDPFIHQLAPEMLAECAAKRAIVEHYQQWQSTLHETPEGWTPETATAYRMAMEWVVLREAQPYADRPGFDPAWKVAP